MKREIVSLEVNELISSAFDLEAFQAGIRAHGVKIAHYRSMRNPVGMIDRYDSRRPDADHSGASNGIVYTRAGVFSALLIGNSKSIRAIEGGILNAATAQITPTTKYDDSDEEVYLSPMDRLYLKEESVLVPHQQLVEAHESGYDKLQFPAIQVLDLLDANGVRYRTGDYAVVDGQIHWCNGSGPSINAETGVGRIYSVKYLYRPYWYVERMLHEIRVAQYRDPVTGERRTAKMPQSAAVQREYVFESEAKDEEAVNAETSRRQAHGPRDGGFGPR